MRSIPEDELKVAIRKHMEIGPEEEFPVDRFHEEIRCITVMEDEIEFEDADVCIVV